MPRHAPPLRRNRASSSVTLPVSPVWGIVAVTCGVAVGVGAAVGAVVGFGVAVGAVVGAAVGAGVGVAVDSGIRFAVTVCACVISFAAAASL